VQALQPTRLTDLLITWGRTNKYQGWFYRDRTMKGSAWSSSQQFFLNFVRIQNCRKTKWPKQYNSVFRNRRKNWEENFVSTLSLLILRSQFCIHIITADSSLTILYPHYHCWFFAHNFESTLSLLILRSQFCIHIITADSSLTILYPHYHCWFFAHNFVSTLSLLILRSQFCIHIITADSSLTIKTLSSQQG